MGDKDYRIEILNNPTKLSKHKETAKKTELLDLFATYVYMANPDYKYNETYLKDMIPTFWSNVENYIAKVSFRENLLDKIRKCVIPDSVGCQLNIQIDETWKLQFDNTGESIGKWEKSISETLKLDSIDREKTYVKCQFNSEHDILFSDYLVAKDEEQLLKFAIDSVESFINRLGEE